MTLDTRAAPDAITHFWGLTEAQWHDRVQSAVARADAAESRYAQLSALVDTWQRRFNLELQRALAAESELGETREALELAEGTVRSIVRTFYPDTFTTCWMPESCAEAVADGDEHGWCIACEVSAFLARLPTEEENDG